MIKEITVAGIKLNNYFSHEKLMQVEKNLAVNAFTVIEDVYMRTVLLAKEDATVKEVIESIDITEIADGEILDAVNANTIFTQKEIETKEFFFQLMRRVERSGMSVFVVAEKESEAEATLSYLSDEFTRMKIAGYQVLDESIATHEEVINKINMIAPDVIVSVIASPAQEHFLADHKGMISAKIWYGIGSGKMARQKHSLSAIFWKKFRHHKLLKYVNLDLDKE